MKHTRTGTSTSKSCHDIAHVLENMLQNISPVLCKEHDGNVFFRIASVQEHTRTIIIKLCVEEINLPAIRRSIRYLYAQFPDVTIRESSGYCPYHYKQFEEKIETSLMMMESLHKNNTTTDAT